MADTNVAVRPIDLHHLGNERVIGSYLVETEEGLALHDCGPSTTIAGLEAGLAERGLELRDLHHLLLSHIHFDHAGATGVLVRRHPALQVHVSEIGAPHLIDPSRLESSARRLYGESFDTLWGELAPVPEENVHVVGERVLGLECFPAPGHASHQVCYLHEDGTLYAGDAAGVRIAPAAFTLPPTPPPDIDLEAWNASLSLLAEWKPESLAITHFGVIERPFEHLAVMRDRLAAWAALARELDAGAFEAHIRAEVEAVSGPQDAATYLQAVPPEQQWHGLDRYWRMKDSR
jgi:glyoxylase-like metal-dependent hydrolase (beta-lactamase superfamily II)